MPPKPTETIHPEEGTDNPRFTRERPAGPKADNQESVEAAKQLHETAQERGPEEALGGLAGQREQETPRDESADYHPPTDTATLERLARGEAQIQRNNPFNQAQNLIINELPDELKEAARQAREVPLVDNYNEKVVIEMGTVLSALDDYQKHNENILSREEFNEIVQILKDNQKNSNPENQKALIEKLFHGLKPTTAEKLMMTTMITGALAAGYVLTGGVSPIMVIAAIATIVKRATSASTNPGIQEEMMKRKVSAEAQQQIDELYTEAHRNMLSMINRKDVDPKTLATISEQARQRALEIWQNAERQAATDQTGSRGGSPQQYAEAA